MIHKPKETIVNGLNANGSPADAMRIVMKIAALASFVFISFGLALAVAEGHSENTAVPLNDIIFQCERLRPDALTSIGILILVFIPALGLLTAAVGFACRRKTEAIFAFINLFGLILGHFILRSR